MKIVQSFWSGNKDCLKDCYGWLSPIYHYASWILSCNQLRKYYDDLLLVTDRAGYDILINKLHLPYTDVIICLDELSKYNSNLWALAKIKAYEILDEPFIHVDGDVFIWEKIDTYLGKHDLITQNIETTTDYYRTMWNEIRPSLDVLPEYIEKYDQYINRKAYNMGIFGGNDIPFIKDYCRMAFDFVNQNLKKVNKLDGNNFNIFFEQILLYGLTAEYGKDVATYIKEDIKDNEYKGFADFDNVPENKKFLHLLGFNKKLPMVCNKLLAYIAKYYPEYVMHLENLFNLESRVTEFNLNGVYNMDLEIMSYKESLLDGCLDTTQENKNITLRDITALENSRQLESFLISGERFIMVPTHDFTLGEKELKVKIPYNNEIRLPALSIDSIIFGIISKKMDNVHFCHSVEKYLDDSFSENKKKEFFRFLWKRITLLTSYGVLVPVKCNL